MALQIDNLAELWSKGICVVKEGASTTQTTLAQAGKLITAVMIPQDGNYCFLLHFFKSSSTAEIKLTKAHPNIMVPLVLLPKLIFKLRFPAHHFIIFRVFPIIGKMFSEENEGGPSKLKVRFLEQFLLS